MTEYLRKIGLAFDPFEALEAASDRRLTTYLVPHDAFEDAWNTPFDIVAIAGPSGSGRTAIAERLVYSCRVAEGSSNIFPVLLREDDVLLKAAAAEFLLSIVYQPERFEGMDKSVKQEVVAAIEAASPGLFGQLLPQIAETGTYLPLSEYFDLPGGILPVPPDKRKVRRVVQEMQGIQAGAGLNLGRDPLKVLVSAGLADEVMIIADIGRGRIEQVTKAVKDAQRQLGDTTKTTVKLLLDTENPGIAGAHSVTKIAWRPEQLVEVLQQRVRSASAGEFDSLDAISDLDLRGIEGKIVSDRRLAVATPRDAIAFAGYLLQAGAETGDNLLTRRVFNKAKEKFTG